MLGNFILETANAPGTAATVTLAGAAAGRVAFSQKFQTGAPCYYFLDDGSQAEAGSGTFTVGPPNTISRATVIWNSAGNTSRLNFTGQTRIYNEIPAERRLWLDTALNLALPGNVDAPSLNQGQLAGFRNAIINGAMEIAQRGTSFTTPASNTLTLDRWRIVYDGSGSTFTVSRQPVANQAWLDKGFRYMLQYAQTVAGSGGTTRQIIHKIEGVRSFAGRNVTVSISGYSDAPRTVTVWFAQVFGTGGSPSATVNSATQNWSLTTTPADFSATFALPTINGKTLGSNNDDSLTVLMNLPLNTAHTINMTGVTVEPGIVKTPFEWRPPQQELALCQRYYQTVGWQTNGYSTAGTSYALNVPYPVVLRATPTVTPSVGTQTNCSGGTAIAVGVSTYQYSTTVTGAGVFTYTGTATVSAEL
jgi:hypothetical protein